MKYVMILFFSIFCFNVVKAQQVFINNIAGNKVLNSNGYEGVSGSPYLFEKWAEGEVMFKNASQRKISLLKYDMMQDVLLFSEEGTGAELTFVEPVVAFDIRGARFQNNFPAYGDYTKNSYYQIIANTTHTLLKKNKISIAERTRANMPPERYFRNVAEYFVYKDGKVRQIKITEKSLALEFGLELNNFKKTIDELKINLKSDADLKRLFESN